MSSDRTDSLRTSNAAKIIAPPELHDRLPALPHDEEGPVFATPWEAQAFALALALHERGVFTWKEWAQTLSEVIAEVRQRGEADTGKDYYRYWLTALERIVSRKNIVTAQRLSERREQWADAARRTPHGKPIEL